jgi:hypothetical protein
MKDLHRVILSLLLLFPTFRTLLHGNHTGKTETISRVTIVVETSM